MSLHREQLNISSICCFQSFSTLSTLIQLHSRMRNLLLLMSEEVCRCSMSLVCACRLLPVWAVLYHIEITYLTWKTILFICCVPSMRRDIMHLLAWASELSFTKRSPRLHQSCPDTKEMHYTIHKRLKDEKTFIRYLKTLWLIRHGGEDLLVSWIKLKNRITLIPRRH